MRSRPRTIWISILAATLLCQVTFSQTYPPSLRQIKGRVIDMENKVPVPLASVFLAGSSIGTVANSEGDFILKIPGNDMRDTVVISSMGYESVRMSMDLFHSGQNEVHLRANPIPLDEVTVVNKDALDLIIAALDNIRHNYGTNPMGLTAFYRESIQKGKKYIAVSEAVLEGYKASYSSAFDTDRVLIKKARKSSDYKNRDTLAVKLQGGPHTMFQLDFIKNPSEVLHRELLSYYEYHLSGQTQIDQKLAHVISFHQLPEIEVPLYKGYFFVDQENLAIMGAEFHLHEDLMDRAAEFMVKSQPLGAKIEVEKADYVINYRYSQNRWQLYYVLTELAVKINWDKKLFNSTYTMRAEMAVTSTDTINVTKFKRQEALKGSDIFEEQVVDFEDPEFWGEYNIIRPEESILSSIKRMERKNRSDSPSND